MASRVINYSPEARQRRNAHTREYHRERLRAGIRINYSPEALERRREYARKHLAERRQVPEYRRECALRKHRFSLQEYGVLLERQGGVCPVCKNPLIWTESYCGESPTLDHDHSCCQGAYSCGKCIRGILHARCNSALGCVDDNPTSLRNAADYLERTSRKNEDTR